METEYIVAFKVKDLTKSSFFCEFIFYSFQVIHIYLSDKKKTGACHLAAGDKINSIRRQI